MKERPIIFTAESVRGILWYNTIHGDRLGFGGLVIPTRSSSRRRIYRAKKYLDCRIVSGSRLRRRFSIYMEIARVQSEGISATFCSTDRRPQFRFAGDFRTIQEPRNMVLARRFTVAGLYRGRHRYGWVRYAQQIRDYLAEAYRKSTTARSRVKRDGHTSDTFKGYAREMGGPSIPYGNYRNLWDGSNRQLISVGFSSTPTQDEAPFGYAQPDRTNPVQSTAVPARGGMA